MKSKNKILMVVLALALFSCKENDIVIDPDKFDYRIYEITSPTIATIHAPLYECLKNWMNFDELTSNSEGVICITYSESTKINWNEDEIGIEEFRSPDNWGYDVPAVPLWTNTYFSEKITGKVPIKTREAGSYITVAELASCEMTLTFTIPSNLIGNITFIIPKFKKNGQAFAKTYNNLQGPNNVFTEKLENYKMEIPEKELELECEFIVNSLGGATGGRIDVKLAVSDVSVNYMKGYFGQVGYTPDEADKEITFDFFKDLEFDGSIGIKDIIFETRVNSKIGIPLKIEASEINFINEDASKQQIVDPFAFEALPAEETNESNHTIAPKISSSGEKKLNEILFVKGKYPTKALFNFSGMLNPEGDKGGNNFIFRTNTDLAEAKIMVTVPLHIKVDSYNRKDTIEFDYNDMLKDDEDLSFTKSVEKCEILLEINNQLPFGVLLKIYAIDEAGVQVGKNIVTNLRVAKKSKSTPDPIELTQDQLESFSKQNVKNIVLDYQADTGNTYEKVTVKDFIDIGVQVKIKASIPHNLIFD